MTARTMSPTTGPTRSPRDLDDPLLAAADPVAVARERITAAALSESAVGPVGLELELHLVDLADPARRPTWPEVLDLVAAVPSLPARSTVTLEPGGQIELSTPPGIDVVAAVAALRADRAVLREALRGMGYGAAPLGTRRPAGLPDQPRCPLRRDGAALRRAGLPRRPAWR